MCELLYYGTQSNKSPSDLGVRIDREVPQKASIVIIFVIMYEIC